MNIAYVTSLFMRTFMILFAIIVLSKHSLHADDSIILVVNNQVITDKELEQYRRLLTLFRDPLVLNATKYSQERQIVMDAMIQHAFFREQMKRMQSVSSEQEIKLAIISFAKNSNISLMQLSQMLQENDISYYVFEKFVTSELAKNKFQQALFQNSNNISKSEIDEEISVKMPQSLKVRIKKFKVSQHLPRKKQLKILTELNKDLQKVTKCINVNPKKYVKNVIIEDDNISTNELLDKSFYSTLKVGHPSPIMKIDGIYQIVMVCDRKITNLDENTINKIKASIIQSKLNSTLEKYLYFVKSQTYIKVFDHSSIE